MKYPRVIDTFKRVDSITDIDLRSYDSIAITGGEPLLYDGTTLLMANLVKTPTNRVYLYTNGLLLNESFLLTARGMIDGINIGLHDPTIFDNEVGLHRLLKFNEIIPVRILVWEKLLTDDLKIFFESNHISYRAWVMDECDNLEDRFILR